MKKMFLLAIAAMVTVAGFSQVSIGLHGTGNLADAQVKSAADLNYKKKMRAMPGAGVDLQVALSRNFAIRTGANYIQHGITLTTTLDETVSMKVKLHNNLHYVQVPVNLLYTLPVFGWQLYAGGGGFINYGISGKTKSRLTHIMPDGHESVTEEENDAFKKEEDGGMGLKKTDYGVSALAGLRMGKGLFVHVGYQLSLANIDDSSDKGEYKNRGLQLTIGYFFK